MRRYRLTAVAVMVVDLLLTASCGGGGGSLAVKIHSVAIDLQFQDPALAKPIPQQTIIKIVPAPNQPLPAPRASAPAQPTRAAPPTTIPSQPPAVSSSTSCAAPPPKTGPPAGPATDAVSAAPKPGAYRRVNSGTSTVTGGPSPVTVPIPVVSQWTVGPSQAVTPAGLSAVTSGSQPVTEYEVVDALSTAFIVTTRYRITATAVQLVKRTWADGDRTLVFAPDPPVDTYRYGAVGSSWNSAGADNSNNIAMAVSGTIQQREPIDVCGLAVDTYQVSTTESLVDLATGEQIGTNTGAANVTNIATQLGGLLVRQQVHVTDSRRDSTGKDVSVEFDYTSTLTSLDPGAGG